jgi:hypothetical protein
MQTVNFQCGHCRSLMAVGVEYLGKQVRCPHCQNVVLAPPAAAPAPVPAPVPPPAPQPQPEPPPPLLPTFLLPTPPFEPAQDEASIFSPPPPSDDLFGEPAEPRLELPAASPPLTPPPMIPSPPVIADIPNPSPDVGAPAPVPAPDPVPAFVAPASQPQAEGPESATMILEGPAPQPITPGPTEDATLMAPEGLPEPSAPAPRPQRAPAGGDRWWLYFLVLPLLSYAILATILIVVLFNKVNAIPPDPLEKMPDVNGDTPGVRKAGENTWIPNPEVINNIPISARRRVGLGQTVSVGELEVTPLGVEQRKVKIFNEKNPKSAEETADPALVLSLRLRNVSDRWSFSPLDNYFDRKYEVGTPKPLTYLEVGGRRFYGGVAKWYPRSRASKNRQDREWLEKRVNYDDKGLAPGEHRDTILCTDPDDPTVLQKVTDFTGNMLWRIQLRRGVVQVGSGLKPATTIIGVEFGKKDIQAVP